MKTSVLLALCLVGPGLVSAQSDKTSLIIASVADARSGQPIADAEVKLADVNLSAKTDWSGEARIANVGAGQHNFQIVKAGYDSLVVTLQVQGDSIGPVFRILKSGTSTPAPVAVAATPRTSYLVEFEKRREQGHGKYLTASDLEAKKNRPLVTVLAQSFSGLMSTPDATRPGHNILVTRRTRPRLSAADMHCGVDIYLDSSPYLDDLEALQPSDLAGVEYYPIESAPGEYRRLTDNCGVLILWSKK